ncbi:MAG: GNAT family N-acetyltransferase [Armatimonadota bacterium]
MNNTVAILDSFYAYSFGCKPENLRDNNLTLVSKEDIGIKFAKGYPLGFLSMDTKNGCIAVVKNDFVEHVKSILENKTRIDMISRFNIVSAIEKRTFLKEWFTGVRFYCDKNSFIDCSFGKIEDITNSDEWAIDYCKKWHGKVFGQIADGKIVSRAAVKILSDDVADLRVETDNDHRGKGYAKSVVSAALKQIFDSGRVAGWGTDVDNKASINTAVSVGFEYYADDFGCII